MQEYFKKYLTKQNVFIFLLCIVALLFRLANIDAYFWYDEACSHLVARESFPFGINEFLWNKDLQHTPLYFYILNLWMKIFGEGDVSIKSLSILFGMAMLPLIFFLTKKLANEKAAFIVLILASVNVCMVLYSQEARMYSMVMFLALLSSNYLVDWTKTQKKSDLIKLSVVNILIPYTLVGAIAFNIAQFICYFAYLTIKRLRVKDWLISGGVTLLALIPYFIIVGHYNAIRSTFIVSHVSDFAVQNVIEILRNFLSTNVGAVFWAGYGGYEITFFFICAVIIPAAYMLTAIFRSVFRNKEENSGIIKLFFAIIVLVFAFNIFFAMQKTIVLATRYVVYVLPLVLILASIGISKLRKWHIALFLLYFSLFSLYDIYTNQKMNRLKETQLYLPAKTIGSFGLTKDDLVIVPFGSSVFYRYYDIENNSDVWIFELLQEYRRPENRNFYTEEQTVSFKEDFHKTLQEIVLKDDYISPNFYRYIKENVANRVAKSRYVVFNLYGPDISSAIPPDMMKEIYADIENVKRSPNNALFAKSNNDLRDIMLEDFNIIDVIEIPDNLIVIFQRK